MSVDIASEGSVSMYGKDVRVDGHSNLSEEGTSRMYGKDVWVDGHSNLLG
jgi:hypothetical protein